MQKRISRGFYLSFLVSLFLHILIFSYGDRTSDEVTYEVENINSISIEDEMIVFKVVLTNQKPKKKVAEEKKVVMNKKVLKRKKNHVKESETNIPRNIAKEEVTQNKVKSFLSESTLSEEDKLKADEYILELRRLIDRNKSYPKVARRLKQHGIVVISIKINKEGLFEDVSLTQKSTSSILDKAALRLVQSINRFKPLPKQYASLTEFKVPIKYVFN